MKIALVSTGLGRVARGFETFTDSLAQALTRYAPSAEIRLFQGGGRRSPGRVVVPNLHRQHPLARWLEERKAGLLEQRSFALCFYPLVRKGGYDIVHYNELAMGSALFHLRRVFGGHFKLLYCNGAPSPPSHFHHRCDFAQLLTAPDYERAKAFGLPDHRLFLNPYGVDGQRFSPEVKSHRAEIRRQFSIPREARIVLTVAALKREHKRIDYLIREVSKLDESFWLLAAGQRTAETPALEQEAAHLLGGRWRFVTCRHDQVPFLYGAADVFVLPSLTEAFGLVTVEAMLCGIPVFIHQGPIFHWIAQGASAQLIDMTRDGELAHSLRGWTAMSNNGKSRDRVAERFSWKRLVPQYLEMYQKVVEAPFGQVRNGQ